MNGCLKLKDADAVSGIKAFSIDGEEQCAGEDG